jgi:hypothetical protein
MKLESADWAVEVAQTPCQHMGATTTINGLHGDCIVPHCLPLKAKAWSFQSAPLAVVTTTAAAAVHMPDVRTIQ